MRFYECNGNRPYADYDAPAKRKGADPDFSYADKVVVPKVFLLATKNEKSTPSKSEENKVAVE